MDKIDQPNLKYCLNCGEVYEPKRMTSKYCSNKCKLAYLRSGSPTTKEDATNRGSDTLTPSVKTKRIIDKVNKELVAKGLPQLIRASELPPIEWMGSGISEIDELTKGFPKRLITEIFGMKGVGKTTLMTRIINSLPNANIFYVDAENALTNPPNNVEVFSEGILERAEEGVEIALQSKAFDLIVIDSVAALIPWAEMEGAVGDAQMGLKARLMSQWTRRINYWLKDSKTAVVFINQQRDSMTPWGAMKFTPGGYALGYAASLRLELKCNKADKKEKYQEVTVIVEKSRFSRPYLQTKFKLYYE